MCSLNNDQKKLLFDHTLGLADKYEADQVEELIASNYEAAEIHSNLKAVLSPLDTLKPEPCPAQHYEGRNPPPLHQQLFCIRIC